jgi:type VI secretion system protein ImpJ
MSRNSKVLWTEGLFLQPHHFQQHDRYLEWLVDKKSAVLQPYPWGVHALSINSDLLAMGKVAITEARGMLPDGTPFNIPDDDPPPDPLELDENVKEQIVYLALPLSQSGLPEARSTAEGDDPVRYVSHAEIVRDSNVGARTEVDVETGRLTLRLVLEQENRDAYASLGVARVVECRADKQVMLDQAYIPPCLDCQSIPRLADFLKELSGLLHHRGETLANRIGGDPKGGVADWSNFLLLQLVNRLEPLAAHLQRVGGLHPETLYRNLVAIAGELATFTVAAKRPPDFPVYKHDALDPTFTPVMALLRDALSKVLLERAIAMEIEDRKFGFRVALLQDQTLLKNAGFVVAANAKINTEILRTRFPAQFKIGPVQKIQQFVKLALPGIALRPLPQAPREIPYHAGFTYFELDRSSEFWDELETSGGFGMHIGGEFPGLELEFWAIRD